MKVDIGRCLTASVLLFALIQTAQGNLIIDDAVFAHDFENISGNTITALRGPDASKTGNVMADTVDPISQPFSSSGHIQAPTGDVGNREDHGNVDTNTRLIRSTSALSFSTFYNARNDPMTNHFSRLLSSFNGTGLGAGEFIFQVSEQGYRSYPPSLRFLFGDESGNWRPYDRFSSSEVPTDNDWHQAGFVFDSGILMLYSDGVALDTGIDLGIPSIPAQKLNWFLVEDATSAGGSASAPTEYFINGDYDEAALWYRALTAKEMNALYEDGLEFAVPEPSTILLALPALGLAGRRGQAVRC